VSDDIVRWSDEGRQLLQTLGGWLEEAGAIHDEAEALERERAALAQELRRLEQDNNALRAQRDELHEALQTIVSQTTRTADEILYRLEARRGAPGDLASR
jgi:chromosome segregation ATPase